jgi:hypothetical protein
MSRSTNSRLCAVILVLVASFCLHHALASGDTGTYKILDYAVKLTPKSDGTVEIAYYQKWLVTGGDIPWITVGTPNSSFQILDEKNTGNIRSISRADEGNWSGVRIDLDKDYRPDETFQVGFTILQSKLFWADKDNYHLDFTPGWYDRAETDRLRIEVFFFAKLDTVTADPGPTRIDGQSMIWDNSALPPGERFSISVSFPKALFPQEIGADQLRSRTSAWTILLIVLLLFGGFALIIILIALAARRARRAYGPGGIYYGSGRGGGASSRPVHTGGGGGFGGRSFSCACACAGCACACACAGGGAAGCDRKLTYTCPLCNDCDKKDTCPLRKGARAA